MKIIYEYPQFDTGLYDGHDFYMSDGNGQITIHVMEYGNLTIEFYKIRHHKYTALPNCTKEHIKAYFKLLDMGDSEELKMFTTNDKSSIKAYNKLTHYMVFFDESGCHEIFCEGVKLPQLKSAQQVDAPESATMVSPALQTPQRPAR